MLVRFLGAAELAVGTSAFLFDSRATYSFVAAAYLVFTTFIGWALYTNQPLASCGCFGIPETPAMASHVLLTLAATGVTASAAADGSLPGPLASVHFV
jgi:hypothetical protein